MFKFTEGIRQVKISSNSETKKVKYNYEYPDNEHTGWQNKQNITNNVEERGLGGDGKYKIKTGLVSH